MVLVVKTQPYLRQQLLTASEKIKFWETPKQDGKQQKIQGSIRLKQPKARNIEVINKEVWRKTKENVSSRRDWLKHNVKVI